MKCKTIIGLETHIELGTKQKMFCGCAAEYFGKPPNSHVCPVCLGLPGALPVPNKQAIEWTILIGLSLNCKINLESYFERKHYFYPDLPKGFQISQYQKPFCYNGWIIVNDKKIKITRVHLEEDTGKLLHGEQLSDPGSSYIDFNRSGVPLVEIVTEPDIDSPNLAVAYLKQLQLLIQYLGVSDCDMEKGSMRCEPNISLKVKSQKSPLRSRQSRSFRLRRGYGGQVEGQAKVKNDRLPDYKVEIKNINSFKFVKNALKYEQKRQQLALEQEEKLTQETRRYLESSSKTEAMRTKEFAQDYRYFPEPDIPPISFKTSDIKKFQLTLSKKELPKQRIKRFQEEYKLDKQTSLVLVENKKLGDYYLELVKQIKKDQKPDYQNLANLLINRKISIKLNPTQFIEKAVNLTTKKPVDPKKINPLIKQVIINNPQAVQDYKKGKQTALQFLLGQVLRETGKQVEVKEMVKLLEIQLK